MANTQQPTSADDNDTESSTDLITACAYVDKGGVGKTTTIGNIGVALSRKGYDVLLMDLAGKQGDLSKQFGLPANREDAWPNVATIFNTRWNEIVQALGKGNILDAPDDADHSSLVVPTGEGPDLIPAHAGLDGLDNTLGNEYDGIDRYTRLEQFIEEFVAPNYDVCLIDLPGAPNNVTYNGVFAAESVIAPVKAGQFEAEQAVSLAKDINTIRQNYDRDVNLTMLIENEATTRTKLTLVSLIEDLDGEVFEGTSVTREQLQAAIAVNGIPESQDIVNSQAAGTSIFGYQNPSETAYRARHSYESLADELIKRIHQREQEQDQEVPA